MAPNIRKNKILSEKILVEVDKILKQEGNYETTRFQKENVKFSFETFLIWVLS